ncbi:MAG: porin [Burkholderiales bacterium]
MSPSRLWFRRLSAVAAVLASSGAGAADPATAPMDDPVRRLLDLQLRKGIITREEYDEFMAAGGGKAAAPVAGTAAPAATPPPAPAKPADAVRDGVKPTAPAGTGLTLVNTDALKIEFFGTLDVSVGYTSQALVPSGEMPTSIGPSVSGGVKTPYRYNNNGTVALYPQSNMRGQVGLFNSALSTSSWGIRATRDLGNGRKAFVLLDSAFNPVTGQITDQTHNQSVNSRYPTTAYATSSLNGQLFGKEAYVGLSDTAAGRVTVGRNNNFLLDVLNRYAPLGKSGLFVPYGNGVFGGGGGISENARVDNSIKYTHAIGRLNVGVMHGFGGTGGLKHGAEGTAGVIGYETDRVGVQFVVQTFKDLLKTGVSPNVDNTIDLTAYDQRALLLAGKASVTDRLHVQAGVQQVRLFAASGDPNIPHIGNLYGETVSTSKEYVGETIRINTHHLGFDYDLTDRLNLAGAYTFIDLPAYSFGTNNASRYRGGRIQAWSGLALYKLFKNTDLYAGLVYTHYSGEAFQDDLGSGAIGSAWNNSTSKQGSIYANDVFTTAAGIRFRF